MKKVIKILTLSFIVIAITSCSVITGKNQIKEEDERSVQFFAMDTFMDITFTGGDDELMKQIESRVNELDSLLSTTDSGSEIYKVNENSTGKISPTTKDLLEKALVLCEETGGLLDISIYPIVKLWGFTTGSYTVPNEEEIMETLEKVDYRNITIGDERVTIKQNMQIDLGSLAKGYAGDEIISTLKAAEVKSAILNLGGNVQTVGTRPDGKDWKIGIRDPFTKDVIAVVEVNGKCVVTSGGYERYFTDDDGKKYGHIMDPRTGYPVSNNLVSVSIVGESGLYSDALSTSLYVLGFDEAVNYWKEKKDFEAIIITEEKEVYITPNLESKFNIIDPTGKSTLKIIK